MRTHTLGGSWQSASPMHRTKTYCHVASLLAMTEVFYMWPFLFPTSNLCTLMPLVKNRPALASKPSTSDTYRATGQLQPQGAPTCQPAKRHPPMPENIRRATIYDIAPMTIYETVRPVRLALGAAFPRSFLPTEIQDTPEQSSTIAMETRYTTNGLTSAKCSLTSHAKITAKRTARGPVKIYAQIYLQAPAE